MRERWDIESDAEKIDTPSHYDDIKEHQRIQLEVLLDIRELLAAVQAALPIVGKPC